MLGQLHIASYNGDLDTVKLLIKEGEDPHAVDSITGMNCLHYAVEQNHSSIINYFLTEHKLNINAQTIPSGKTALILAVAKRHNELCAMLINRGADINEVDADGLNIFHYASMYGNYVLIKYLFQDRGFRLNKANLQNLINAKCYYGKQPIFYAIQQQCLDTTKALLENGAELHVENNAGETLLLFSVKHQAIDIFKYLISTLDMTRSINKQTSNGDSCLLHASRSNHLEIMKTLIQKDADCLIRDHAKRTLLHYYYVNTNIITMLTQNIDQLLLLRGVNPNAAASGEDVPVVYFIKNLFLKNSSPNMVKRDPTRLHLIFQKLQLNFVAGLHPNTLPNCIIDPVISMLSNPKYFETQQRSGLIFNDGLWRREYQTYIGVNDALHQKHKDMLNFLNQCGVPVHKVTESGCCEAEYLFNKSEKILSLQRLASNTVRVNLHPNALTGIHKLHFPQLLKDFILLKNIT